MVTESVLLLSLAMAAVTYLSRGPILVMASRLPLPAFVRYCLEAAPAAALATLTVSLILYPGGQWAGLKGNPSAYAALVTLGAALYLRNILLIVGIALAAFHAFKWLLA
ncbi:MAG: AzlD domain-containing protein [Candidatus Tectomicrobia bacterium]|nr:AzlD domain-containing protein [Candidatus Tectomicrobia bacterium]